MGTGSIGMQHLRALAVMEEVSPVAIPKRPGRALQLKEAGYDTADSLDEAASEKIDLCIIATDTGCHVQDTIRALEAGLDVLIEKPMAVNSADASLLQQKAHRAGRNVYVGCVLRFCESLNIFSELRPQVGEVHSVQIQAQSFLPDWRPDRDYRDSYSARPDEGGVLRDLIHEVDYAGWIFGWPSNVQARLRNLRRLGITTEETADLTWETPSGCSVSLNLDYLSRPAVRQMKAYGELGTIEWEGINGTVALMLDQSPIQTINSSQTKEEMLFAQDRAFVETICHPPDPRLATGEDGVRALAICDAARIASGSRRDEQVEYP
jgi:predicted dehydrogenase